MFDQPRAGQFTQGTIFSCAYAEKYQGKAVYGLVITARCDAAQDKAPIYNFLPVVPLTEWIQNDGAEIILERVAQDAANTQRNLLQQAGLSDSLLKTTPANEIIEKQLLPLCEGDRKWEGRVAKFREASETLASIASLIKSGDQSAIKALLSVAGKYIDGVLKELAANRLLGHYILREMPTPDDQNGMDFVVLLREVHHIPNQLGKRIVAGIAPIDWRSAGVAGARCPVFCSNEDYCMPVARLKSPWMEHLMQSWTMLFARIGVEDIDVAQVKKSLASLGLEYQ